MRSFVPSLAPGLMCGGWRQAAPLRADRRSVSRLAEPCRSRRCAARTRSLPAWQGHAELAPDDVARRPWAGEIPGSVGDAVTGVRVRWARRTRLRAGHSRLRVCDASSGAGRRLAGELARGGLDRRGAV